MTRILSVVLWGCMMLVGAGTLLAAQPWLATLTDTSPEFVVTTWQMPQGLPSDRVRAVLQTSAGYIWVATFNGVARFDGVRFEVYNDANTPALRNNLINSLFEDGQGRLWMGSDTGEITWRDGSGFHALTDTNWPSFPIDRFAQSATGTIWAVNRRGRLLRVSDSRGQAAFLGGTQVQCSDIVSDREGQIWAVRYGGMITALGEDGQMMPDPDYQPQGGYRNAAMARQGGLWIRDGHRLRRWLQGKWVEDRGIHNWNMRQSVVLYETSAGDVWVGTRDDGAFVVLADGSEQHINRTTGLAHDLVSTIKEDREGNIWVGTDGGGLGRLRQRALFMIHPPDLWQHRAVLSVSPSSDGGLWIGTEGAGVYKLRGAQFTQLGASTQLGTSNTPTAMDIRTAVQDPTGKLWVGTQGAGLLAEENDNLVPITSTVTHVGMPDLFYAIYETISGELWMGSQHGVIRFDHGRWSYLGEDLYRSEVRCVCGTPDGSMWIGMRGGGVACYRGGKFVQFLRPQGLPYEYAWALYGDSDNSVWIGTPGAGLIQWHDGHFASLTAKQGLPSDFICSIVDDQQGHLWIGSYAGIFRVAKADLARCAQGEAGSVNCCLLDTSDGLTSLELAGGNQPSACRTDDGRLWFATSGGLAMVEPSRIRTNALAPPVLLEEALLDGKRLPLNGQVQTDAGPVPLLTVPPGGGQLELRYTALSFCDPQRVRFRYRLEKVDSQWVEAGGRRAAYYSHLPPGEYHFRVLACNNDGVWNQTGAPLALVVQPHLWQTWWFVPLCWLAVLSSVGAATLTGLRRRHRTRIQTLERERLIERERGRIARDLHDDLGSGLTDIGTTSALAQDLSVPPDEAREYLREISQRSTDLVGALDEIVWAVNPKNDDLGSLATYFSQFAERFVRLTPVRCRFEIPEALPPLPLDAEQRHSLFLAFKEALQNAVKHSGGSSLRVSISVVGLKLVIIVEDNGRGFVTGAPEPGADGLRNMRERLEQLGGRCEIASTPGKGTRVTFTVPVKTC